MKYNGWIAGILGLWPFVATFLRLGPTAYSLNDIIVGLIVLVAGFRFVQGEPLQAWIACILGFWLIVAACIPGLVSGIGLYLNNIIVGLVIAAVGFRVFSDAKKPAHYGGPPQHADFGDYGSE